MSLAECAAALIPRTPLSTLTTGKVAIPAATSSASFIVPVGKLENPTPLAAYPSAPNPCSTTRTLKLKQLLGNIVRNLVVLVRLLGSGPTS